MKKISAGLLALAATAFAGTAQAQICAGFPTVDRQFSFEANLLAADGVDLGDVWGVEASYNAAGPLAVFGGLTVQSGNGDDLETYNVGLAFDLPSLGAALGPAISVCPTARLSYTDLGELEIIPGSTVSASAIQVPLGIGFGTDLSAGTGFSVSPFVIPALYVTRVSFDAEGIPGVEDEDETETDFGLKGGLNLGFGTFFVGGTIEHIFQDESDPVFGIRAGIRL